MIEFLHHKIKIPALRITPITNNKDRIRYRIRSLTLVLNDQVALFRSNHIARICPQIF